MTLCGENYFTEKYDLTRTHSGVVEVAKIVAPGKTLDLDYGNGRDSLYLAANGYDVTAWGRNSMDIASLEHVKATEGLINLNAKVAGSNALRSEGEYDFVLSTVVLMFLEAKTIPGLTENMQRCTKPGGYNLIITAMDTDDFPYAIGLPFTFKAGELRNYYNGQDLLRYSGGVGELHHTDENGNQTKLRFATMLARRTS